MNSSVDSLEVLRKEVEIVLASLSMRERQAFKMMMNMKLVNQSRHEEEAILKALLQELVALKPKTQ